MISLFVSKAVSLHVPPCMSLHVPACPTLHVPPCMSLHVVPACCPCMFHCPSKRCVHCAPFRVNSHVPCTYARLAQLCARPSHAHRHIALLPVHAPTPTACPSSFVHTRGKMQRSRPLILWPLSSPLLSSLARPWHHTGPGSDSA